MKILNNVNFGLKEIVNSESAVKTVKEYTGKTLKVTGILIGVKEELDSESGELKTTRVVVLKEQNGELISSISPTVIGTAETIISAYAENNLTSEIEKGIDVNICSSKSGKGREFYFLQLK